MLDPGYITTRPGTRNGLFYAPGSDVDPRIVARDESTKGTVSQFEIANYPIFFRTVLDVRAPAFIINGSLDGIFCSQTHLDLAADCTTPKTLVANERPWFPAVPSLDAAIIPDAGHDLNAFRSSQRTFSTAMDWVTDKVSATSS